MSPPSLPPDYFERVYAGVLGKIIGVYLGRPFEMWSYQKILSELGPIKYYVHSQLNVPLVVIDDDISGTFTFIRALAEHGFNPDLKSREIGQTWLNNVIDKRSVFWWGGNGISTEHTAYRNLKAEMSAPESGAVETNGKTVAEQIGAQIFIDGWAMVCPGQPDLAARLAREAARVSHDGEAVYAATLWAAMEAEAFTSKDVDHLLDTGLGYIPHDCLIARLAKDVRTWAKGHGDWKITRQKIEDCYGYDKYSGICHVVPNHGIMIMALVYGGHNFHEAMHIINTCGWDTDCNSGNVGCLLAIMHGLQGLEGGPDWRGPIADRVIISSADGGYSINNAARIAFDIANTGRQLTGKAALPPSKNGAQFHFSLPGSVQGFQPLPYNQQQVRVEQDPNGPTGPALAIHLSGLTHIDDRVEILTDTFTQEELLKHKRGYELMASPLVYPGQQILAVLQTAKSNTGPVNVNIRLRAYDSLNEPVVVDGPVTTIKPGDSQTLEWKIPRSLENQPIHRLGLAISTEDKADVTVWLDSLKYSGAPQMTLRRPEVKTGTAEFDNSNAMWHHSWVNAVDVFHKWGPSFFIAHDHGEGMISHGTRDWRDYQVVVPKFKVNLGAPAGIAVRVQGLNRWYALLLSAEHRVVLVKAKDDTRTELAAAAFDWKKDESYEVVVKILGSTVTASIGSVRLQTDDDEYEGGGIGLIISDGSLSIDRIEVEAMSGKD